MTSFVPRYYEIEQALRTRIAALEPHSTLPSDAQLCNEFGVSRMTARNAVQRLVQEGLVYRVPGRGTFVAAGAAHRTATHILSFSDEMRRRGRVPSSRVVEQVVRAATDDERVRLGTEEVAVLRRVRLADGEPIALETAVFAANRVAPVLAGDLERVSLFEALARSGNVPTAGRATIAAEASGSAIELRAGELELRVLPARGLDIGAARCRGETISWTSPLGELPWQGDFARSFGGGLLVTCGLRNVGVPSEGQPQHGWYTSLAARDVQSEQGWTRGRMVEAEVPGPTLELTREIRLEETGVRIDDTTRNLGHRPEPAPLLYHCNFLWDAVEIVATTSGMAELKRSNRAKPVFD